jgi:hypothetical protein
MMQVAGFSPFGSGQNASALDALLAEFGQPVWLKTTDGEL